MSKLHYIVYYGGKKSWLTMLHGLGGNQNSFRRQIEPFSAEYNLLIIEMPGHGGSADCPLYKEKDVHFRSIAENIVEVLDELHIEKTAILGISIGAMAEHVVETMYPERFTAAVYGGTPYNYRWLVQAMFDIGFFCHPVMNMRLTYTFFAYAMMPGAKHAKSRQFYLRESIKMHPKEFIAWCHVIVQFKRQFNMKKLVSSKVPKLFIQGGRDLMFCKNVRKYIPRYAPNAKLEIIEDCGHVVNLDAVEQFNQYTLDFLREHC